MPQNRSPATVAPSPSSTTALGWAATASCVLDESWLPRTYTYGTSRSPMRSTSWVSGSVPQSVRSPVSTMASMPNCSVRRSIRSNACGLRWMSLTCSTRISPLSGSNTGSSEPARYSVATLSTRSESCSRYSPKRSSTASMSPTAGGARVSSPV